MTDLAIFVGIAFGIPLLELRNHDVRMISLDLEQEVLAKLSVVQFGLGLEV